MSEHTLADSTNLGTFSKGRALVVSVAAYPKVTPLPPAVINDAREIVSVLTAPELCGYAPHNVKMLLDDQATLEAIRREIAALAVASKADDTVVVFFSGHGARLGRQGAQSSALVPYDCDLDYASATMLLESELSSLLAGIHAQRLLVLIDACHSGAVGSLKSGSESVDLGFSEKSLDRLAVGKGRVIVASSRGDETSLVLAGARNSLFTEHFLKALRGGAYTKGDGLIRVFDVFNYVAEHVKAAAPGRQHPIFKASDLEDNFPLALFCGGTKQANGVITIAQDLDIWGELSSIMADLYPAGPQDQEIWIRSGGDLSRLRLTGTGRANWFVAIRTIRQGGGGVSASPESLIKAALDDYPRHQALMDILIRNFRS